ncbi:MAG TPA: alpha/beta fold hydrolase [Gemmatimonadales bacterium]
MIAVRVTTADGVGLALHRFEHDHAGLPPALLVHGAFTSHRMWIREGGLAPYLASRGFDVWLADLRHHGASDREPRPRSWHFEDLIRFDAPALVGRVRAETGHAPAWVGHSFGGVVGLCWLARGTPPGAVANVVGFGTPGPTRISLVIRALTASTAGLCEIMGRLPARALRLGPEDECARVFGDWMLWNAKGRWTGRDGFDYLAALPSVRSPYLGVAGDADRLLAPARRCSELVERVGATTKELLICGPRLDHVGLVLGPRAPGACWPRVVAWLQRTRQS